MIDIKHYAMFQTIHPITKGWSSDKKYYVETTNNEKWLLRIADISEYSTKEKEFHAMKRLAEDGVPISRPIDFGICDNGKSVYSLFKWCEGEDAALVLPKLTVTEQYELGLRSGRILRQIHQLPAPSDREEWENRFRRKVDSKINKYLNCGMKIDGDDKVIAYIEANKCALQGRPQCFHHGDYHVGNMVISPEGELYVIDFSRHDYGDPWEEFNRIVWTAAVSPYFATGQLNGYFEGRPPESFFQLLAFYICSNMLGSLPWAMAIGDDEVKVMMQQAKDVMAWFDEMKNPVPSWYLEDFYIQYINQIPYRLKAPFDFSFLEQYGDVFKVYDDQDSGNICFGVKDGEHKYFVKFAGAPTARYSGKPEDAIARLKSTVPIYQDLSHPNLVKMLQAEEVGGGFAVIFEWSDGECMGKMYPRSRERFLQMSERTRLEVFDAILDFHIHVIKQGYVAIDFYDGSIMYDFRNQKTLICDIDYYAKMPYTNTMGRMWGSSRFMSPEEFTLGATIDEITNVYVMGATAFVLFGGEIDRSIEKWRLNDELYKVALKAVSDDRSERQPSLTEFAREWREKISFV